MSNFDQTIKNILPDPDQIGQSEYRAIHELLMDALPYGSEDTENEVIENAMGIADEVLQWAQEVHRLLVIAQRDARRQWLAEQAANLNLTSQSARDAQASGYGDESYWLYLDKAAQETHDYYIRHGQPEKAAEMLTRSLSEALQGNDGA